MKKLFLIGDSISIHYGPYLEKLLPPGWEFDRKRGGAYDDLDNPMGENAGDSAMVLSYLKSLLGGGFTADLVLLNCGLHDIKRTPAPQVAPEEYRGNLAKAFALLSASGINTVWVTTTPVDETVHNSRQKSFSRFSADVDLYNKIALEEAKRAAAPVIDLHGFTLPLVPEAFCDHVHFKEPVREKQAEFIARELSPLL